MRNMITRSFSHTQVTVLDAEGNILESYVVKGKTTEKKELIKAIKKTEGEIIPARVLLDKVEETRKMSVETFIANSEVIEVSEL